MQEKLQSIGDWHGTSKVTFMGANMGSNPSPKSFHCAKRAKDGSVLMTSSWCYKTLFGRNLDFPKIKKLKKVCSDLGTSTKTWKECYFKQTYTLKLFIAFRIGYSWFSA